MHLSVPVFVTVDVCGVVPRAWLLSGYWTWSPMGEVSIDGPKTDRNSCWARSGFGGLEMLATGLSLEAPLRGPPCSCPSPFQHNLCLQLDCVGLQPQSQRLYGGQDVLGPA